MIPRYAPEWTNHNPSDPGITLIELAAWMTDLLIYRLNQVPDKNYVAFLNLLGIKLRAPRAAQRARPVRARRGRAEAARAARHPGLDAAGDRGAHRHVRDRARRRGLDRAPRSLLLVLRRQRTRRTAATSIPRPARSQRLVRGLRRRAAHRALHLPRRDPRFANTGESSLLRVFLGTPERGGRDLARLLEWEYWDGTRWKELEPAQIEVDRGEVAFLGPMRFEPTTVNHVEGLWMRGRLAEVPQSPEDTEIDTIRDARRGRRRGPAADPGVREPRQQRVPPARPVEEPLSVRQGAEGRLHPLPRVRRAAADRRRVHLDRDAARRLER